LLYKQDLSADYHPAGVPAVDVKPTFVSEPTTPNGKEAAAIETSTEVPSKVDKTKPVTQLGSGGEFSYGYESVSSYPFRTMFFVLILLGVPTSLFLWCGGMRMIRHVTRGKGKAPKYKRVMDEDLEK